MVRKLTDSKVKNATCKADGKPLNLSDGGGLYLHVKAGSKKLTLTAKHKPKFA